MKALAKRYAAALADVALEQVRAEAVKNELASFVEAFAAFPDLRNFLESPAVPKAAKQAVVEKLAARLGVGTAVRNFLFVVLNHRRVEMLPEIRAAFEVELNARLGIAEAEIIAARDLSPAEKDGLTRILEKVTGKRIAARYGMDAALLAGAVVRIGSTIYDGSVREQLRRLRARLEAE